MPARLLIVDDEPSICFALSRYFSEQGHEVFVAPSAEEAIAKLAGTRPDVIFLDIRLPGISGLEAMEALGEGSGFRVQGSEQKTEAGSEKREGQGSGVSGPLSVGPGGGSSATDNGQRTTDNSPEMKREGQASVVSSPLSVGPGGGSSATDNGQRTTDSSRLTMDNGQLTDFPPALIIMTAHGTMEAAIQAMSKGAYDYLVKPISLDRAGQLVDRLMESRAARQAEEKKGREPFSSSSDSRHAQAGPEHSSLATRNSQLATPTMVGSSPPMQELFKQIGAVAARSMPVLVLGETGSGKELVARAIHAHGPRAKSPFVAINAAALPDTLIESELFGFEKGAFTGADRRKPGRFEEADSGTLFLDEIGELPAAAQAKLLRFLDEPVVSRLGSTEQRRVDVRLIAATHRDLHDLVAKNQFRADLLFRLNVARVRVPPLRERREDIPALAAFLLRQLSAPSAAHAPQSAILSAETISRLEHYDWPGNVRELRNVLQQALLVARDGVILPAHLPPLSMPLPGDDALARRIAAALGASAEGAYDAVILPIEKELLRQALQLHEGNLSRAADHLGVHRATLRTKLRQHGLAD